MEATVETQGREELTEGSARPRCRCLACSSLVREHAFGFDDINLYRLADTVWLSHGLRGRCLPKEVERRRRGQKPLPGLTAAADRMQRSKP